MSQDMNEPRSLPSVLADHRQQAFAQEGCPCCSGSTVEWEQDCDCGFFGSTPTAYSDHLAEVVLTWISSTAQTDATVALVEHALEVEGAAPGSDIHSWCCVYPDTYGPCECVAETAVAVVGTFIGALRKAGKTPQAAVEAPVSAEEPSDGSLEVQR